MANSLMQSPSNTALQMLCYSKNRVSFHELNDRKERHQKWRKRKHIARCDATQWHWSLDTVYSDEGNIKWECSKSLMTSQLLSARDDLYSRARHCFHYFKYEIALDTNSVDSLPVPTSLYAAFVASSPHLPRFAI